jgi:hypothetical protein
MSLSEFLEFQVLKAPMVEMANLFPRKTGLLLAIWFGEIGGQQGPRIKVSNIPGKMSTDCFVVSVNKNPKILTPRSCKQSETIVNDIFDWIIVNYDDLMIMWDIYEHGGEYSKDPELELEDVLARLQKI